MGEAGGNPELLMVIFGQLLPHPPTKSGRVLADIYRNIPYGTAHHTHQLTLGMRRQLVVQPTQHTFARAAVVILHKLERRARSRIERCLVEAFVKKATYIPKHLGLNHHHLWNGGGDCFHRTPPLSTCIRYWP